MTGRDPTVQRLYKDALAGLTTGVTVVTTHDGTQDVGMTCNTFTSVSLEPALVLWCLRHDAASHRAFTQRGDGRGYTLNVLAAGQLALAQQFARGSQAERFAGVAVDRLASGRARLQGGVAWFDCALHDCVTAGDHDILIGRVLDFGLAPQAAGLACAHRVFGALQPFGAPNMPG